VQIHDPQPVLGKISRKSQARLQALPSDLPLRWRPLARPEPPEHAAIVSNQRKTVMINIVLALTLTATALASVPVAAAEQEKDRCVLTEDAADKIADCQKLPRKNASLFDELARKNKGLLSER
jgi:hypothetical protein